MLGGLKPFMLDFVPDMKKTIRILFSLIALAGVINCFLLEPALAFHEDAVCVSPDGCDDCLVCCSFNHQAIPLVTDPFTHAHQVSVFIEMSLFTRFDSPSFSIFHPPLPV